MEIDLASLFAGFALGVFGLYLLKEGRRLSNPWHLVIGLLLMIFPYFIEGVWATWGMGLLLIGLAYLKR